MEEETSVHAELSELQIQQVRDNKFTFFIRFKCLLPESNNKRINFYMRVI